jgi:hypothetical protein
MDDKLELTEILALIDTKSYAAWDELSEFQQKHLKQQFYVLNRFISSVKTNDIELQEHFVEMVNECYNKHWNALQSHPALLWRLLCMCGVDSRKIQYHEWIGFKKQKANKSLKFLETLYPTMKKDELELLATITPVSELKQLAIDYGYDTKQIKTLF